MKTALTATVLVSLSFILYSFVNPKAATYSLTIEATSLRNETGIVQFALYNKDGSVPDKNFEKYYKILTGEIVNGTSKITFENIPSGKYAVNIVHDENRNGKIDRGFILPVEGIGFSNFQSVSVTNRPNFSKASFELNEHKTISIKMIYM